jgi:C-terminal processing protease CtpA/Prc
MNTHRIQLPNGTSGTGFDLDSVYDVALGILNERTSDDDSARVLNAAMTGMLSSVEPSANYMDAKRFGEMQVSQSGHFGGLGIEVTMENGLVRVVTPMDGTPASRGGVMANDIITNIDDVAVKGLSLNEAVGKMRGPVGSTVRLKFLRKGVDNPMEVHWSANRSRSERYGHASKPTIWPTQPPFGANAVAIANQQHPDEQLGINRRPTGRAVKWRAEQTSRILSKRQDIPSRV